jgi:hypothetical protein
LLDYRLKDILEAKTNLVMRPGDIVSVRRQAGAGDILADEVADQEAKERVALDRRDGDRGVGVLRESLQALVREGVDGALARLARFLACVEIPESGEPFRLDVVLALTSPGEDPSALGHVQESRGSFIPGRAHDSLRSVAVGSQQKVPNLVSHRVTENHSGIEPHGPRKGDGASEIDSGDDA